MLGKGSKLYSIFNMKCPQCQEGEFFISKPYDLKNMGKLHDHCEVCGLKFEKEPGFYYGAMYVSYALQVVVFTTFYTSFSWFFPSIPTLIQIFTIIIASIFVAPYLYALSKIIWANFFIKFKKDATQ